MGGSGRGAIGTAALTLLLVAFGAGLGLSAGSPWSDSVISGSTFKVSTGIYLVIVGVMSSAVGGYLAGRLRTRWVGLHTNEVFFRDTAHGFLAWALATLIGATALVPTTAYLLTMRRLELARVAQATQASNPSEIYVDKLFRTASTPASATGTQTSGDASAPTGAPSGMHEISICGRGDRIMRLWTAGLPQRGRPRFTIERAYLAQVVAAHTGISQADAEKRVDSVVNEAKTAADNTRRNAAHLSFWLTAALLFGALSASLAAAEGGTLRDGTWTDRVLTPRTVLRRKSWAEKSYFGS